MANGPLLESEPNSNTGPYSAGGEGGTGPKYNPTGYCVGYVYMRSGQATGYFMPYGHDPSSSESKYPAIPSGKNDGDISPGNVILCKNHVMFIEDVVGDTVTISDSYFSFGKSSKYKGFGAPGTISKSELAIGKTLHNVVGAITGYSYNPNGPNPKPPTPPTPPPGPTPEPEPEPDPSGGDGRRIDDGEIYINENCESNTNPEVLDLITLCEKNNVHIDGEYNRDPGWSTLNKNTYERQIHYGDKSTGYGDDDGSQLPGTEEFDQTGSD